MARFFLPQGIAIGQETKGVYAAYLASLIGATETIRYGGCNGSHYVLSDGLSHSFTHFGSSSFAGLNTTMFGMVIDPFALFAEAEQLESIGVAADMFARLRLAESCLSITPFHGAISQLRELIRAVDGWKKGTVGMGVGEALSDARLSQDLAIRAGEFANSRLVREKLLRIRELKNRIATQLLDTARVHEVDDEIWARLMILRDDSVIDATAETMAAIAQLAPIISNDAVTELLRSGGPMVVEGSHGTLLHPWYGFVPHVSQVDSTGAQLIKGLRSLFGADSIARIGVLRSYSHRHGAGPLVSQDDHFGDLVDVDRDDDPGSWLGPFRIGPLDFIALRYSIACVGGPGTYAGLAVSHLDDLERFSHWPICTGYVYDGKAADLDTFFIRNRGVITGIRVHPDTRDSAHRRHQEQLTQRLMLCRPVIEEIPADRDLFLRRVGSELQIPVVLTGFGPDVRDHAVVTGHEQLFR